jgi:hypothetical protein
VRTALQRKGVGLIDTWPAVERSPRLDKRRFRDVVSHTSHLAESLPDVRNVNFKKHIRAKVW